MKKKLYVSLTILLALGLSACGAPTPANTAPTATPVLANASPSAAQAADAASTSGAETASTPVVASTDAPDSEGMRAFIDAFQTVQENPLGADMSYTLYLDAKNPEPVQTAPAGSAMAALLDKLKALVGGAGLHYVDAAAVLGMEVKTEHWVKGEKFKTVEELTGDVTVFDGTTGIRYNMETKTGRKMESIDVTASRNMQAVALLTMLTVSPYESKPDEKFGQWDCAVFHMDIEFMGMKGNTVYIDKATGLIVKNVYGDPKDEKNSMATVVQSMDTGGFGDDVFAIPADITIE